jgi:dolichyl-phosphate-mannose--protein O-mannosyl transferase
MQPDDLDNNRKYPMLKRYLPLVLIVILAFGLRFWGITNGQPYVQLTDETSDIAEGLRIVSGEPPNYTFHRTLWPLSLLPIQGVYFGYLKLTQPGFSVEDFRGLYFTERNNFILLGRLFTVLISTLTVLVLYFLGRVLTDSHWGGMLTALLMAVQPAHAYNSHFTLPDPMACCG